ncbi:glycosyltransferase [Acidisoma cellulosilytica]|uniref:Glycosyltransferase n=1 Tax=Acidisoma cellulosilyticum TaxID=2802395 RepID=A0A963Z1A0_9PROT|nr:glycosyltransferase [Acidisoma cellulosilyticum]MCB8880152.1 glycosyltransferase [Acidisoma cellulosilyticum]
MPAAPTPAKGDRAKVAILLSTYNGAPYLPALLGSFLAQTHEDWVLLWRDDGSRDGTTTLMRDWGAARPDRCAEVADPQGNQGVTGSFMALLRAAHTAGFAQAAFADQDDVWLPEKLAWGLEALGTEAAPALYCARQVLVDDGLTRIGLSASLAGPAGFPACLTQNIATGNTVILNRAALGLIAPTAPPRECWHDWWCYLMVTAAGGRLLRDERGVILYRQHAANVVGAPTSAPRRALAALRRGPAAFMLVFRKNVAALQKEADAFNPDTRQQLEIIAESLRRGPVARLRALRLPGFTRNARLQTALFRLWFLIG